MLSASGHKIHGPKGAGFLYVDSRVKIKPIIFGGGQQKICAQERKTYLESQDWHWRQK